MASYVKAASVASAPRQTAPYGAPTALVPGTAPAGTFAPGTKIQVGGHRVIIQKYLSEGGFAHVYLVKLPSPVHGTDQAVLKRVAVPDKDSLRGMRTEVETMKRLKGHKAIVTYIDSHASELRGGGYEVFLLMEYCNGGGLIDFMNTRLQHRLTEPEIMNIFIDVAEGVACMHYLRPPLLHRDLKVENVLIAVMGSKKKFKLCDFGSAVAPQPAPTTVTECRLMDEDVQKHTTMQYRSPEMVDVYRKLPIDEKSDIWALGVLLYKLCYYTTPFEDQGQLAILNATYKFHSYPVFSDRLKKLIAFMLRESPQARPNIHQVLSEACAMMGREPPVKDIHAGKPHGLPQSSEGALPAEQQAGSPPVVGAVFSPQTAPHHQVIPEVKPMRRGRPKVTSQPPSQRSRPSPSPGKLVISGDPFSVLDSKLTAKTGDEFSNRFPTLDQFSILHNHGAKFNFDSSSPTITQSPSDLTPRVPEKLAADVFQTKPSRTVSGSLNRRQSMETMGGTTSYQSVPFKESPIPTTSEAFKLAPEPTRPSEMSRASAIILNNPELQALSSQAAQPVLQPAPTRPSMVSIGTMTAPTPPPDRPASTQHQIHCFPSSDQHRASSVPRQRMNTQTHVTQTETLSALRPKMPPASSPYQPQHPISRHASSSRPSLEGGRPSLGMMEPTMKTGSQNSARPRPASTYLESNLDYLWEREKEASIARPSPGVPSLHHGDKDLPPPPGPDEETNISSNVEFLRSMEDSDLKKKEKGHKNHLKRSSLTSLGAGTKSILAGKFGDAFKRFEGHLSSGPVPRTPSPLKELERRDLTPIAGSEATDGRSDDGQPREDDLTPEMRREREQRMLDEEEARVAAAQAEYRQHVASRERGAASSANPSQRAYPKSIGGISRAVSIQNKVQSLLQESSRSSSNVTRTAEGYGRYSDLARLSSHPTRADGRLRMAHKPQMPKQPTPNFSRQSTGGGLRRMATATDVVEPIRPAATGSSGPRPLAPPKPGYLNKTATSSGTMVSSSLSPTKHVLPLQNSHSTGSSSIGLPRVRAREVVGAADLPAQAVKDDYIRDFQKRFPSLTSFEMVERDLGVEAEGGVQGR